MVVQQARVAAVVVHLSESFKLSIIIPVLNEGEGILPFLNALQILRQQGHELILVDGGSVDETRNHALPLCDQLLSSPVGRARQMNAGAEVASGNLFLFLHADTFLPNNTLAMLAAFRDSPLSWGRFDIRLSGRHLFFRVIEYFINHRSRLTGIATGDQALFMSPSVFEKVGQFPDQLLMEDVEISKRLRRISHPFCIRSRLQTSSRRWEQKGILSTVWLMWRLRYQYYRGASPEKLYHQYYS
jgi:rSAM/selenodomain-associated transferase 2